MTQQTLSPVVLFVFARPEHTLRTLQALSQNDLADSTKLYIFADGPRDNESAETRQGIEDVRRIVRQQKWCGNIEFVESDVNKGLANSIIDGVQSVTEQHGRAIVLEDDLETSPGFLKYMNDALSTYADDERVMQISGFNVRNRPWAAATGFLRVSTSWGWATWDRAWKQYDNDAAALLERVRPRRKEFDLEGHSFHFEELERNVSGDLKTWAVRWYASIFLKNGLCLYPGRTLVRNHGFDGTGVNCHDDTTDYHRHLKLAKTCSVQRQPLSEQQKYLQSMQKHFDDLNRLWSGTRLRDRIARKARSFFN